MWRVAPCTFRRLALQGEDAIEPEKMALLAQRCWRGYISRKKTQEMRADELVFIGSNDRLTLPPTSPPALLPSYPSPSSPPTLRPSPSSSPPTLQPSNPPTLCVQ
jgi:hypothetical protein